VWQYLILSLCFSLCVPKSHLLRVRQSPSFQILSKAARGNPQSFKPIVEAETSTRPITTMLDPSVDFTCPVSSRPGYRSHSVIPTCPQAQLNTE
jgi:hypothetical protein